MARKLLLLVLMMGGAAAFAVPASAVTRPSETVRLGVRFGDDPVDVAPAGPSVGDQIVVHDTLVDARGRRVGRDAGVCTFTSIQPPVASCAITFPRGQIAAQFINTPPPRKRAAIVGGTRRYRAARGELTIVERADQTGTVTFRVRR